MGKITGKTANEVTREPTVLMQEEIRHTEAEITDTLHSIEAKLAPRRLREQAKTKLVNGTVNTVVQVGYTIKRRPVPSVALGAGVFWLLRRRARKPKYGRRKTDLDTGAMMVQALPKELRKSPMKTMKKYLTLGRMAFAFVSVAGAVLMRGKRAQQALYRERYGELGEYPAHP